MDKPKLRFRFYNPNPPQASAEYIAQILAEAQLGRVEELIRSQAREEDRTAKSKTAM